MSTSSEAAIVDAELHGCAYKLDELAFEPDPRPKTRGRSSCVALVRDLGDAGARNDNINSGFSGAGCRTKYDYDERTRLLAGAHTVDKAQVQGRKVLLFDDLYRSGATMNAITAALYDDGAAADVFALTITRTRSNQ